jgi:hypothetical protein
MSVHIGIDLGTTNSAICSYDAFAPAEYGGWPQDAREDHRAGGDSQIQVAAVERIYYI